MRLHTDKITFSDIFDTVREMPGVYALVTDHKSRSRERAFEVQLRGNGTRANSGTHGADIESAATWDEWGTVIGALYRIDPHAVWGSAKRPTYAGIADFRYKTHWRFTRPGLPRDTHKRHTWRPSRSETRAQECAKCSAVRRFA